MASRGDDWTRTEVEAAVADYLFMLASEWTGKPFNKAERNRALQALTGRSHGSIERKHQNISAVLRGMGIPWIEGYKPLGHRQALLEEVVRAELEQDVAGAVTAAERLVESPAAALPPPASLADVQVNPPEVEKRPARDRGEPVPRPTRIRDYVQIDAQNRSLGKAGEEFTVLFEQRRLWDQGRQDLSRQVEHVAVTKGDGLGFDVQSFELDGGPRLIEVKTTSFGARTPFFISANEVVASERLASTYQLYRVFNFRTAPQFFALKGHVQNTCRLSPDRYMARAGLPKEV